MVRGRYFRPCFRADGKCEVYELLWGMGGCPLLAWQAHSHRFLDNNELTTLPATVFSDLTALEIL
jgi:hypothetical protein